MALILLIWRSYADVFSFAPRMCTHCAGTADQSFRARVIDQASRVSFKPQGIDNRKCGGKSDAKYPGEVPHRVCSNQ
jgi:hypothetical protein